MNHGKSISPAHNTPLDDNAASTLTKKEISIRNRAQGYGLIAIFLHWLEALSVVAMFILGLWMTGLTYYDEWYKPAPDIHRSVGILLFFTLMFRIYWRITNVSPHDEPNIGILQKRIAHWVHLLLYFMLISMIVSGYLISTADGRAIDVFGWFQVPAIFSLNVENLEDKAGVVHWYLALVLIVIAGLHALAALKHHFIDRDRTLSKMLGTRSR